MPSISPKDLKLLDDLCKEYRIKFIGELPPDQWPESYKTVLQDVAKLGETKAASYATDSRTNDNEPWKLEVKQLAFNLMERAKRSTQRNESSWRFACEPLIFARLSSEVAW